ncbi:hypothetical protein GIB67_028031 [Kingdonia uniflora]|uniref:Uncharacterized protein n=1 Tax=Kingdonia uniflora TaxID=39325 RepID=A0A7J7NES0_9MAGN|nr:hypothetical protein GIB67_028031 [Kingdonia uniflora]
MQPTIFAGYLFTNNTHLIWESLRKGTQTLGIYYAKLRSSWEKLSHYDSFIEWPASAPSEKVPPLSTTTKIYAKIVEKTRVFQFLAWLNPDFEYARVHLLDMTHFPTLEEAHAYCLSEQSCQSPMPPISDFCYGCSLCLSGTTVYTPRHPGRQPPTPNCQASSVPLTSSPVTDSPLSEIEPSPTSYIPVTTDDDSHVSHSDDDDDRPITIRKEKRNARKPN